MCNNNQNNNENNAKAKDFRNVYQQLNYYENVNLQPNQPLFFSTLLQIQY